MMDIVFRKATSDDKEAIEGLFVEMLQSICQKEEIEGYEKGYLDRFFLDLEDRIVVAVLDHTVIGYISIEVKRQDVQYVYIDDFCVKKEYRGLGIGTRLLRICEEYCHDLGLFRLCLHVERNNVSAQHLYCKNGYDLLREDGNRLLLKKLLQQK